MDSNETRLRWTAAWWVAHGVVAVGAAVVAVKVFGKDAKVPAAIVGVVAHHALDTPLAVKLNDYGI